MDVEQLGTNIHVCITYYHRPWYKTFPIIMRSELSVLAYILLDLYLWLVHRQKYMHKKTICYINV